MENNDGGSSSTSVKAKIMAHSSYHRLLAAYANCQKVKKDTGFSALTASVKIQALDQFMEAYCEMLTKYEQELSKPLKEAMLGARAMIGMHHPKEELDVNNKFIDPQAEDQELKVSYYASYSGYLGSLKKEFMKKRKKGKLPKEARQQLLDWWSRHHKWPYPSESQKLALAESTGLDQKQIKQLRKRHWKPSEDMQFVVMDAGHPHYYMDNVLGNPFPMDISHTLL
ncbi:hypothetical protein NC651_009846 [Populus alba x Populus x berolinensis]|nr:hypothetical protein NC651_009846 [Populus alba x Populus x berolinensis]